MKEIPVPYLRANQAGIVAFVLLAVVTHSPVILALLLLIEIGGLAFGPMGNLFIRFVKPFVENRTAKAKTESGELARFNNTLAVIFLVLSGLFFALGWPIAGFITAGLLAVVAFLAITGFCVGCVLYYRFKQLKSRLFAGIRLT